MINSFSTPQRGTPAPHDSENKQTIHDKLNNVTPSHRTPLADISSNRLQVGSNGILSGAVRVPIKEQIKDKLNTPKTAIKPTMTTINSVPLTSSNFMRHTEASLKNVQTTPSRGSAASPAITSKISTPTPSKSRSTSSVHKHVTAVQNNMTPRTPTRPLSVPKQRPNTPTTPSQTGITSSYSHITAVCSTSADKLHKEKKIYPSNVQSSPASSSLIKNQSSVTGASSHSILFSPERIQAMAINVDNIDNIDKGKSVSPNDNTMNNAINKKPLIRSLSTPKGRSPQFSLTSPHSDSLVFPETSHPKKDGWDSNTVISNNTKSITAPLTVNHDNNSNVKNTPSKQSHTTGRSQGMIKSSVTTADILSANKAAKNAAMMASYKKANHSQQPASVLSTKSTNRATSSHNANEVNFIEKDGNHPNIFASNTTPIKKNDSTKTLSVTFSSSTKKAEKVHKDIFSSKSTISLKAPKSPMKKMDASNKKIVKKVKKNVIAILKNSNILERDDEIHKYFTTSLDADSILNALESSPHRLCNAPAPPSILMGSRINGVELRRSHSFGSEISSVQGYTLEELSLADTIDLSTNNTFILESNNQSNSFTLDTFTVNTSVVSNGPKSANAAVFSQQLSQLLKDENLDLSNVEEDSSESFSPSKFSTASFWTLVSPKAKDTKHPINIETSNLEHPENSNKNSKLTLEHSKSPLLNSNSASYSSFSPISGIYPQSLLSIESVASIKQSRDSLRITESSLDNSSVLNRGMLLDSTAGSSLEMSKILNRGMIMNTSDATIDTQASLYSPIDVCDSSSIKNTNNNHHIFVNNSIQEQYFNIKPVRSISSFSSMELFDNSQINGELSTTDNLNPSIHDVGTKNSVFSLSFGNEETSTQNHSFGLNFGESSISESNIISTETSRLSPPTALSQSVEYQPRSLSSLPAPVIHTTPHVTSYLDYEDCSENSVNNKAVIHDSFHLSDFDSTKNSQSFLSSIELRSTSSVPRYETINSFSIENSNTGTSPPLKSTFNDNEKPDNSMLSFVSANMNNTSISSYTSSVEELQQHNPKFKNEQWTSIHYPNINHQKITNHSVPIKPNTTQVHSLTSGVAISPTSSFIVREENDTTFSCPDPIASQLLIYGENNNTRNNSTPIKSHFIPVNHDNGN